MKILLSDVLKKTTNESGHSFFEILNDGEIKNGCFRAKSRTACIAVGCKGSLEVDALFGTGEKIRSGRLPEFGELVTFNTAKCDTCELEVDSQKLGVISDE